MSSSCGEDKEIQVWLVVPRLQEASARQLTSCLQAWQDIKEALRRVRRRADESITIRARKLHRKLRGWQLNAFMLML